MTVPGNLSSPLLAVAAAAAADAGPIKSVRLNSGDSAHLTRTPSSSGNRKTWTWSGWVKRSTVATSDQGIFGSTSGATFVRFKSNQLDFVVNGATHRRTSQVFRDNSSWYHFVWAVDTTQGTASNRSRFYVNGVEVTDWGTDNAITQDTLTGVNNAVAHVIGATDVVPNDKLDAYLADFYLIDGSQLDPTSFGAFDDNGVWQAAAYSGTYPDNSFHLFDFANESTVGHDSSGNNNDWTANNISTTAGAGNDVLFDVPTNGDSSDDTGAGGELSSNYCTFNPLGSVLTYASFSNGNLDHVGSNNASHFSFASGTIAFDSADTTGFYFEVTQTTYGQYSTIGLHDVAYQLSAATTGAAIGSGATNGPMGITYDNSGTVYNFGTSISSQPTYTAAGDVIGVAVKGNKIWFAKNNSWISGDPSTGTSPTATLSASKNLTPCITGYNSGEFSLNAGQRAFSYSAPTGFKGLCTSNLQTPTIADGSVYFDTKLFTGTGASNALTMSNSSLSPDWVWIKERSTTGNHELFDVVRGANKILESDGTNAEATVANTLTSFDSNGFTLGTSSLVNDNNVTYAAWCWDAGTSNASNTDGSLSSTVRANIAAGTSIVTYTGNLSSAGNATVGHGLGVAPSLVITKSRSATGSWAVQHISLGTNEFMELNTTAGAANSSSIGAGTLPKPTSSVFYASFITGLNINNVTFVGYCFAPVAGYSAFGSYDGNASTDGPFVYTGFRPAWLLIKRSNGSANWYLVDSTRDPDNTVNLYLKPNSDSEEIDTSSEGTKNYIDFLSNGFKLRGTEISTNASQEYVYIAFAENPLQANGGLAR